ncbi:hypothetical protein VD659_13540 [Herbiconiux sp. 11R-BC]|uniref:hypothetical protein n=1 Tax=Herbiconiux sp. 11R-BC TaxID=3111637 RepID=UPI003BFC292E
MAHSALLALELDDDRPGWQELGDDHVVVGISRAGVRTGDQPRLAHRSQTPLGLIHRCLPVRRFDVAVVAGLAPRRTPDGPLRTKGLPA